VTGAGERGWASARGRVGVAMGAVVGRRVGAVWAVWRQVPEPAGLAWIADRQYVEEGVSLCLALRSLLGRAARAWG
jgi:hypothetical protein